MNKITLLITSLSMIASQLHAQHSGNYGSESNYGSTKLQSENINRLYLSDSSFVIQSKVLTHVKADSYVLIFGLSEYGKTLQEANEGIDKRIASFTSALKSSHRNTVQETFVDITTQTQVADYKVQGNYAEQYISGYEQKKNVVIRMKSLDDLDKIMLLAASYNIYDLAKVDYVVSNIDSVYTALFHTSMDVINKKKDLYTKATNARLKPTAQIYSENFLSFVPTQLYESYATDISSEYSNRSEYAKTKDLRKNITHFYDHVPYSGFDRVTNPVVTEPAVAFVMVLSMKYDIIR